MFCHAESKFVGIFEISLPVLELEANTLLIFLPVPITVYDFFGQKVLF
jgi:hypothetical protein